MVTGDARKYLALLKGFRQAASEPAVGAAAGADGLPSADVEKTGTPEEEAAAAKAAQDKVRLANV